MKRKLNKVIVVVLLITILSMSGCMSNKNFDSENSENSELSIPIYPDATRSSYENDSLWEEMNTSLSLERSFYESNSSIEEIIDWYSNSDNLGNWKLEYSKKAATTKDPFNISYGHVKMHYNYEIGIYVFAIKNNESMGLSSQTLIGIAKGNWSLIEHCDRKL